MRILLTGGSSFTGAWFVRELHRLGHEVVCTFTRSGEVDYDALRRRRISWLPGEVRRVWGCPFGSRSFLSLCAGTGPWDVLCHHGAPVGDFRASTYDFWGVAREATRNAGEVLDVMGAKGLSGVVLTSTYFESGEGGRSPECALTRYGLAKTLVSTAMSHMAAERDVRIGRFVIPSPFGPLDKPGFCHYLAERWFGRLDAHIDRPGLVRDHIHVSLLAKAYGWYAGEVAGDQDLRRSLAPSEYPLPLADFAELFASKVRAAFGLRCGIVAPEPGGDEIGAPSRNDGAGLPPMLDWDEDAAWRGVLDYYRQEFGG